MEHEFIQTSNEYLQYLSDLGRFAVQNLEISARQEELIKDKLGKVILYIVTKRDSDSSLETNKDVAKAEHDFLEIPYKSEMNIITECTMFSKKKQISLFLSQTG